MTVSSPLMVVIGIFMLYRLVVRRNNMRRSVFVVWGLFFGTVTVLAFLKSLGVGL